MRNAALLVIATAICIAGCHGDGGSSTDRGPTANAGADQIADERSIVQLAGAGASPSGAVTYAWSQVSGTSVTLSSTTITNPTFTAPVVPIGTTDVIELQLKVTDSLGAVASDSVRIVARSRDWVVYADIRTGFAGIYAFDAETNSHTTLAELTGLYLPDLRISPDGSRVAYIDDAFDVWSVRRDGTGRVNLGSSRAQYYSETDFKLHIVSSLDVSWSPDGTHLVYTADRDLDNMTELYVVRADGSRETKLPADWGQLHWSPDGSRIGILRRSAGGDELYVTGPDGTDGVKITDATEDGSISRWKWSPDGALIAYQVRSAPYQSPPGIYTVRPDGTARTRVLDLNGFSIWDWLPNGSLVTVADFGSTNGWVLLTVHSDGSGLAKLSPPVAQGNFIGSATWRGAASRVAFGIYDSDAAAVTPLPSLDLFTARPDGTGLVQLNDVPLVGQGAGGIFWAPDGSRIVYQGPQVIGGIVELFSVRSDGTGRVRLNADLSPGVEVVGLIWSPDSSRVVFRPAQSINDGNLRYQASDAFTVRADGTDRVKLNASLAPGRTVSDPVNWAPDGSRLIYTELQYLSDRVGSSDTFSVLPDGTGRVKLNPDTASQYGATWSPDGARLLYEMTDQSTGRITLGLSHPDGTGLVTIKEWNPGEGGPGSFRWVP